MFSANKMTLRSRLTKTIAKNGASSKSCIHSVSSECSNLYVDVTKTIRGPNKKHKDVIITYELGKSDLARHALTKRQHIKCKHIRYISVLYPYISNGY